MIVVSDTSPLTALLTVNAAELLIPLFGEVVVPQAVATELLRHHQSLPVWLMVREVRDHTKVNLYAQTVDLGEAEAIALAEDLHADRLLLDERKGRQLARQRALPVVGLLGVVLLAKRKGLIPSARELVKRLDNEAGVYLGEELKQQALRSVGE